MLTFSMRATEQVDMTVGTLRDKKGNPIATDGPTTVESLETGTITVEPHPDGAEGHYLVKAVGPVDSAAIVQISADAKPGEEVEVFVENVAFEITTGVPFGFGTALGTAEEQPDAPVASKKSKKSKR